MTGIHRRTGIGVATVRTTIEIFALAVGIALGGHAGLGTVAFAILVGYALAGFFRLMTWTVVSAAILLASTPSNPIRDQGAFDASGSHLARGAERHRRRKLERLDRRQRRPDERLELAVDPGGVERERVELLRPLVPDPLQRAPLGVEVVFISMNASTILLTRRLNSMLVSSRRLRPASVAVRVDQRACPTR